MTNHVVTFAVGIDDEGIKKAVEENAQHQIIDAIKYEVMKKIFTGRYYGYPGVRRNNYTGEIEIDRDAELATFVSDIVKETMDDCKERICELAAEKLAESYKRTKAWKDKVGETIA